MVASENLSDCVSNSGGIILGHHLKECDTRGMAVWPPYFLFIFVVPLTLISPEPQANIHVTHGFAYFTVIDIVGRDDQLFPNN